MERLNWSSIVQNIRTTRSGKARFFKPVCVIAAIDLVDDDQVAIGDIDAVGVLNRFSDYVTPFHPDRGNDGYQPLWHLSNNRLWTFYRGDEALTSQEFSDGKPGTRRRLFERFDRLAIHADVRRLWASAAERRALREQMLLMLHESDSDSRQLVPPLFDPQYLLNRDHWPSPEKLDAYFAHLRPPSLFDAEPRSCPPAEPSEPPPTAIDAAERVHLSSVPDALEEVPSAVDYIWVEDRIVVGSKVGCGLASARCAFG